MEKNKELELEKKVIQKNICSDFDDDCNKVENHLTCFLGNKYCGIADGLCPFIHNNN